MSAGSGDEAAPAFAIRHRIDRFPHAWKNSCTRLPRSGLLILHRQLSLELGGRYIAESRVQALLVVDSFDEREDGGARFGQVAVLVAQNLLVLQRFHERLAGRVVPWIALATHADLYPMRLQ